MDLRSSQPYWLLKSGFIHEYPSLHHHIKTDIVILGGGITGALMGWHLARAGKEVVIIDGRHIGMGSTCASTSMLQYEIDVPLHQLVEQTGRDVAVRSYRLCVEAVDQLHEISKKLKMESDFERKPSLQYASRPAHRSAQEKEYKLRKEIGIDIELLGAGELKDLYGIKAPSALFSPHNSAAMDAYAFTHGLIREGEKKGLQTFDKTRVEKITHYGKKVRLHTTYGPVVEAKQLIMANGYEACNYLDAGLVKINSTYALVSEPLPHDQLWHKDALIWETDQPYLYMRTTRDKRILLGGKDEPFYSPEKRDRLIERKTRQLCTAFEKLFPQYGKLRVDFNWAGAFAGTPDGLPYIGQVKHHPNTWFALGFGGNGILFSQIAAQVICDALCKKKNRDAAIFGFDRVK